MSPLRAAWRWSPGLLLGGCGADYSLPPTLCDDYCNAVQRADCDGDWPADCVQDCESTDSAAARTHCEDAWRARTDCFLRADRSAFVCVDDETRIPDICSDERRALGECLAPGSGACFDECLRQAEACGASLPDCERTCSHPEPQCSAARIVYDTCLQDYPVECRDWLEPDTRACEDIPCCEEALQLLACGK